MKKPYQPSTATSCVAAIMFRMRKRRRRAPTFGDLNYFQGTLRSPQRLNMSKCMLESVLGLRMWRLKECYFAWDKLISVKWAHLTGNLPGKQTFLEIPTDLKKDFMTHLPPSWPNSASVYWAATSIVTPGEKHA